MSVTVPDGADTPTCFTETRAKKANRIRRRGVDNDALGRHSYISNPIADSGR